MLLAVPGVARVQVSGREAPRASRWSQAQAPGSGDPHRTPPPGAQPIADMRKVPLLPRPLHTARSHGPPRGPSAPAPPASLHPAAPPSASGGRRAGPRGTGLAEGPQLSFSTAHSQPEP